MDLLSSSPVLLSALIFLARVVDVSLGTVRTIFVFRGLRLMAAAIGFVEVLIWLMAAGQVLRNLDQWYLAVAYAAGFATGNAFGMWLESRIALGTEMVRAISSNAEVELAKHLHARGFEVTEVSARDRGRPVEVLYLVERRRRVPQVLATIRAADPAALVSISDVRRADSPLAVDAALLPPRRFGLWPTRRR